MRAAQSVSIVLALSMASVAIAGDFDGSVALTCTVEKRHDCLLTEAACSRLKPETDIAPVYGIDFRQEGNPLAFPHGAPQGLAGDH